MADISREEIKRALEEQDLLDIHKLRDRIQAAVTHEYLSQTDRTSPDLIILEEMLAEIDEVIHPGITVRTNPPSFENFMKEMRSREERERCRKKSKGKLVKRVVYALPLVAIMFFVGDSLLRHEELVSAPSEDQQQLVITGEVTDSELISDSSADKEYETASIMEPKTLAEINESFGKEVPLPTWLPEGWTYDRHVVSSLDNSISLNVLYRKAGIDESVIFSYTQFHDTKDANLEFEQVANGDDVTTQSGVTVNVSRNTNNVSCVWDVDSAVFGIHGKLSEQDLLAVVESISILEE